MSHRILVAQGGGPTAVINQSLVGLALEARRFPAITRVYGAARGVRGIVEEDLFDLSQETTANLEAVAATPAAALGSTRDKPDLKYCQEIFKVLKAHEIDTFCYIGGNNSSDTVRIVAEEAQKGGHALRAIHIPKTIDNDLVGFDHTPGFPSAARFVAQAFMGANLDNTALKGVYCAVVMGRHAGFLTAASALARKYPGRRPASHLCPRAHLRRRRVPRRRQGGLREARALRHRRLRGHSRREGRGDHHQARRHGREGRARQRSALGNRRARRSSVRRGQDQARHQAGARRHFRLSPALLRRLRLRRRSTRSARGRREGGAIRGLGRQERLGVDPPRRRLRRRLPADPARNRGRQDAGNGERPHRAGGQRRDRQVLRLSRPLIGSGLPEVSRLRAGKVAKVL